MSTLYGRFIGCLKLYGHFTGRLGLLSELVALSGRPKWKSRCGHFILNEKVLPRSLQGDNHEYYYNRKVVKFTATKLRLKLNFPIEFDDDLSTVK